MKLPNLFYYFRQKPAQPISSAVVIRLCLVLIVVLALAAGYFQSSWEAEQKKYLRLEDKFVRLRDQLGREETQRLIDESYR